MTAGRRLAAEGPDRPESPRRLLERHGIQPSRLRGQSFLLQPGIASRIARAAEIPTDASVIEIGPGLGILTRALAPRCRKVLAIEIDSRLMRILGESGTLPANVDLMEDDALKVDYAALARRLRGPVVIVANLPYAISSPLLFCFLEARRAIRRWVLMLQRELGERILAPPGTKAYGALSARLRLFTDARLLFHVGASNFHPRPDVGSSVLRFDPRRSAAVPLRDPDLFDTVVRMAFGQRRKTLANALAPLVKETGMGPFDEAGIAPKARGETLSPEAFARLANAFHRAGSRKPGRVAAPARARRPPRG
jgi:16S rRNA (adenine1518-N6/adenine1519-N6)-dimethyltransferase